MYLIKHTQENVFNRIEQYLFAFRIICIICLLTINKSLCVFFPQDYTNNFYLRL